MRKYLMTGVAAIALCAAFTNCSKGGDDIYNPEAAGQMKADQITQAYNQAFINYVGGPIASNQDWGFGSAGTRSVIKKDMTGYPSATAPDPITTKEAQWVTEWFQNNPGLTEQGQPFTNFYVQFVSGDQTNKQGVWHRYDQNRVNNGYDSNYWDEEFTENGGMDKLLSKDWRYEDFVKRYISLDPEMVLTNPVYVYQPFEKYRINGDGIDFLGFMNDLCTNESYSSYMNALNTAAMPYCDPYERMVMSKPLDLNRVRNGESKYLIRELYAMKYPEVPVPDKIPMPRPVDMIFKDWEGPTRPEFRQDIPMDRLTGNQKWQLWCAEQFLNGLDG